MNTPSTDRAPHSGWYLIRIEGRLPSRWATHFQPMTLTPGDDGTTLIQGLVVDQAALHGLLQQVRDTGLPLISVTNAGPDQPASPPAPHHPPSLAAYAEPTKETVMTTTIRTPANKRSQRTPMDPVRRAAYVVGVLFVITYITSIAAKFSFYAPFLDNVDYIVGRGQDTRVLWGAFFEMILIIANIGTAVALYPVLKRRFPAMSLGFVTARVMESAFIAVGILAVVTLVTMRQDYSGPGGDGAGLTAVGHALITLQEWTFNLGPGFVVGVGNGLLLGYMMYRTRLVPRGMAMLGLVGGPLIVLSGTAVIFGVIEAGSSVQTLASMPEFFWELSLGIYLIVKGFKPSAVTADMVDAR